MTNPFKRIEKDKYVDIVLGQIKDMKVGDSIKFGLHGRSINHARTSIQYNEVKLDMKFRTKKDVNGNLWVARVI